MQMKFISSTKQCALIAASLALTSAWGCNAQAAPVAKPVTSQLTTQQKADAMTAQQFADWGAEALAMIHADLWRPEKGYYADKVAVGKKPGNDAFMWGVGVQLTAMAAAARVSGQPYAEQAREYVKNLDVYRNKSRFPDKPTVIGYDVLPTPKGPDLYYDDNEWVVLALCELYEVTGDASMLERAEKTYQFVMSGRDDKLGDGIYWQENKLESKNTCSNAPAITGALRLYQITRKPEYLKDAQELYRWTCDKLQDKDGLFWDNIKLDGKIDTNKFSYNSALMIRANTLLYQATGKDEYLKEARRIAQASKAKWVRADGSMDDTGRFAHLLLGSFLELGRVDHDPQWIEMTKKVAVYLHDQVRDPNGHYPENWRTPQKTPLKEIPLIDNASVARTYWELAAEMKGLVHQDSMAAN